MRLKHATLFLLFLCCAVQTYTQTSTLKLSEYTLPDLKLRTLDTYFSFGQSNNYLKDPSYFAGFPSENINTNYSGRISFYYTGYLNNIKWQKRTTANVQFSSSYLSSDTNPGSSDSKTFRLSSNVFLESINRKYYSLDEFVEFDLEIKTNSNRIKNTTNSFPPSTPAETVQKFKNITANGAIKTGKGRIDQITDARHAIFIVNALKKAQRLQADLNKEEIMAFANLIAQIKNKRFFDSRIQRIYELETVDSFLQAKNLIPETDIRYFSTLNDLWSFGAGAPRFSGSRFSLAFRPGYSYLNSNISTEERFTQLKSYQVHLGLDYELEKPLNLYLQSSFNLFGYLGFSRGDFYSNDTDSEKVLLPKLNLGMTKTLGFYPNTRTSVEYALFFQYARVYNLFGDDEDYEDLYGTAWDMGMNLDFDYYISPRFRISVRPFLKYSFFKTGEENVYFDNEFLINNQFFLQLNNPQCPIEDCNFNINGRRNLSLRLSVSLSYGLF